MESRCRVCLEVHRRALPDVHDDRAGVAITPTTALLVAPTCLTGVHASLSFTSVCESSKAVIRLGEINVSANFRLVSSDVHGNRHVRCSEASRDAVATETVVGVFTTTAVVITLGGRRDDATPVNYG